MCDINYPPFCYIGETRLQRAIRELGLENEVEIEMHAFELEPSAPLEAQGTVAELMAQKYHISLEEAQMRIDYIQRTAREEGLDMRYATARSTTTRGSQPIQAFKHSLMKAVRG